MGLSEVDIDTLQTVEHMYPIHFIQNEFLPWYRRDEKMDSSKNIFAYCKANNKIYVAYSP